jgi:xanthine/CO dehydrogenase XdhC/CoxF family maturation factor
LRFSTADGCLSPSAVSSEATSVSRVNHFEQNDTTFIEDIGGRKLFLNPWSIPETVYICGAGHVAQETAELAVKSGFRTIVLDDREKYANRDRFPTADDVVVLDSFDDCFRELAVTNDSYVIIATRGHRFEKTLVRQALRTRAGYIGLIGSVRKRDALFAELSGEGFGIDDLLRARKAAVDRRDSRMTPVSGVLHDVHGREDCRISTERRNV